MSRALGHGAAWGWDSLDLDWEATITTGGPAVHVLRFRDDFDLGPVTARFDERGFSREVIEGRAILRSHELDPSAGWLGTTELAILHTAFLRDGRTLVLSSDDDAVRAYVSARATAIPATDCRRTTWRPR